MITLVKKNCIECGELFEAESKKRIYCTNTCLHALKENLENEYVA